MVFPTVVSNVGKEIGGKPPGTLAKNFFFLLLGFDVMVETYKLMKMDAYRISEK